MVKQFIAYISMLPKQLRNRPMMLISVVGLLLATIGLALYLWNDVKVSGSWKTIGSTNQWRMILLEKENCNIEGTGSYLGDSPISFTVTGFRTNRFVSFKIHTKDEDAVFQGKFNNRNEIAGEITTSGGSEEKGVNFRISINRE